jgi:hypothetical protein
MSFVEICPMKSSCTSAAKAALQRMSLWHG